MNTLKIFYTNFFVCQNEKYLLIKLTIKFINYRAGFELKLFLVLGEYARLQRVPRLTPRAHCFSRLLRPFNGRLRTLQSSGPSLLPTRSTIRPNMIWMLGKRCVLTLRRSLGLINGRIRTPQSGGPLILWRNRRPLREFRYMAASRVPSSTGRLA